jgi:hypothetical protein
VSGVFPALCFLPRSRRTNRGSWHAPACAPSRCANCAGFPSGPWLYRIHETGTDGSAEIVLRDTRSPPAAEHTPTFVSRSPTLYSARSRPRTKVRALGLPPATQARGPLVRARAASEPPAGAASRSPRGTASVGARRPRVRTGAAPARPAGTNAPPPTPPPPPPACPKAADDHRPHPLCTERGRGMPPQAPRRHPGARSAATAAQPGQPGRCPGVGWPRRAAHVGEAPAERAKRRRSMMRSPPTSLESPSARPPYAGRQPARRGGRTPGTRVRVEVEGPRVEGRELCARSAPSHLVPSSPRGSHNLAACPLHGSPPDEATSPPSARMSTALAWRAPTDVATKRATRARAAAL